MRKSGNLVFNNLDLIEAFRPALENAEIYQAVLRQSACLMGVTLLRTLRLDRHLSRTLYQRFGCGPAQMLIAMIRCAFLRGMKRIFGLRLSPFLRAAPNKQQGYPYPWQASYTDLPNGRAHSTPEDHDGRR